MTNEELLQRCKTHLEYGIDTVTPIEEDFNELFLRFEKLIPKKPYKNDFRVSKEPYKNDFHGRLMIKAIPRCPCCKGVFDREMAYCDLCGQAIDWSDE